MAKKKTNQQFLYELQLLHPDGIALDSYINAKTKIKFKCEYGHIWDATPNKILNGRWCPICGIDSSANKKRKTNKKFYEEFEKLHTGGRIIGSYGKNNNDAIEFECSLGHRWFATPSNILSGKWCKKCSTLESGLSRRKTHEQFFKEFAQLYPTGELLSRYEKSSKKVCVKCEHGHIWESTPNNLLRGYWCYTCMQKGIYSETYFSKFPEKRDKRAYLYFVKFLNNNDFYKIGITTRRRLNLRLRGQERYRIILNIELPLYKAFSIEQQVLTYFSRYRKKQSSLSGNGGTECFERINEEEFVQFIDNIR